jgi:hypothetical protein
MNQEKRDDLIAETAGFLGDANYDVDAYRVWAIGSLSE